MLTNFHTNAILCRKGGEEMKVRNMALCGLFTAVLAVCAWLSVPMGDMVITLQTFGIFLTLGLLGGKRGSLAILVYLLLGAIGAPVFSGFRGGLGALLGTTGGYIFGMLSAKLLPGGNHKIAPQLSPKKSWEGFIGGVALSVAVSLLFHHFNGGNISEYIIFALLLGVCSFFGDVTESGLKRVCGVKDSGNWIPGMGGAFDVLDSFIYVGIVCTLIMIFKGI